MKKILIGVALTMFSCVFQRERVSKEDNLDINESKILDEIFKIDRNEIDFNNKKIAFIEISGEDGKVSYFKMYKMFIDDKDNAFNKGELYTFNNHQKQESGGFDGAIVYWSKFLIPIDEVVKMVKNRRKN